MTAPTPTPHFSELVLERVRLRSRERTEWLRSLWRTADDSEVPTGRLTHAAIDITLDDRDDPGAEKRWRGRDVERADRERVDEVEAALEADVESRLAHLCSVFSLSDLERDALHCCLAASIDPSLTAVYAYLQDDAARGYVTGWLVSRLFGHGRSAVLDPAGAAIRWSILTLVPADSGHPDAIELDPAVRDWLLGSDALDPRLESVAEEHGELPPLPEWPVEEVVTDVSAWLTGDDPTPVRVRIVGGPGSGRRTFAAAVAGRFGLPLLAIDLGIVSDADWPALYLRAQRHAFLTESALAFVSTDRAIRPPPERVPVFPLHFDISESTAAPPPGNAVDYLVELTELSVETRSRLWNDYAPWTAKWPAESRELMVVQHRTQPGELAKVARRGPASPARTMRLLRETARESLGDLVQRLECPFTRDDLVLSPELNRAVDELLFESNDRVRLWERPQALRLFPQGRGLLALFSGSPGTGKTMTAQVIAANLGMDLFRIDLSSIVSKWVGGTIGNLDRLFTRASRLDVVILFDEADALFSRRTDVKDANDRFANSDTGYLLQAIESYQGIGLLSTNRKSDIDPAFLRRLRYVLEFPLPSESERFELWMRVVTALEGDDAASGLEPSLKQIAAEIEVTGAQIKYSALSASYAARRAGSGVLPAQLVRGLERELAKEGRPLGERLRERVNAHAH